MTDEKLTNGQTRRRFLTIAGGTLIGASAIGAAQQSNAPQPSKTFQFGGEVQAWQGQKPNSIQGQSNPTLQLQVGNVYEVTWENLDGQPHNFALQDSNDNNLKVIYPDVQTSGGGDGGSQQGGGQQGGGSGNVSPPQNAISVTENLSQQGATQTLRFVCTQDVAQYICTVHPTTMVGQVQTGGGGQ